MQTEYNSGTVYASAIDSNNLNLETCEIIVSTVHKVREHKLTPLYGEDLI